MSCKYHGEWVRAEELGKLVAAVAADLLPFDALVPVPLHSTRLRQRGFNQSLLIAQQAAIHLDVPVAEILLRTRRTRSQVGLPADDRNANLNGAIQVGPIDQLPQRTLVLIDDVITTGSTLGACAKALTQNNTVIVHAVTVAREM